MRCAFVLSVLVACYSPTLDVCSVTCGSDSPCPDELMCGSDQFCHATDEVTSCTATLNVSTNGVGDAHVVSNPNNIDCSTHSDQDCSGTFPINTMVTLTEHNAGGTSFRQWSGDACDGSQMSVCELTLMGSMSVQANFH